MVWKPEKKQGIRHGDLLVLGRVNLFHDLFPLRQGASRANEIRRLPWTGHGWQQMVEKVGCFNKKVVQKHPKKMGETTIKLVQFRFRFIAMSPQKKRKIKVFGDLKTRVMYQKTSKTCRFGGPMAFISHTCFHIGMISHRLKLKLGIIKPRKGCFFLNPGFVTSLWGKKE